VLHDIELQLIKGEGQHLEFKFELNSARKIAATLSAFSNAGGGVLLIGIIDNGAVAGIRLDEEVYVLQAAASVYCRPEITPKYTQHELKGKVVLEVQIEESRAKPVLAETEPNLWKAWVRYGASNRLASPVHLELWKINDGVERPAVYSTREQKLLAAWQNESWLTLNKLVKLSKLPRHVVVRTLASFVRWGIVEIIAEGGGGFVFGMKEGGVSSD
jgi:predicted HTH transcriptional regulator